MHRSNLLALALAAAPVFATAETITGSVTYLQRMMLPPDTTLRVLMQDTSRADAPATTLATHEVANPGAPPYRFALEYDPAEIDETRTYTLRATIHRGDRLLMTTDTAYPVLTRGGGTEAEMVLRMVSGGPAPADRPDSDFLNTYWKILTLNGAEVPARDDQREAHLIVRTDGIYSSTVGCNRMNGGVTVAGDAVTFRPGPTTLMACIPPYDQLERDLSAALSAAARFDIRGETMDLRDGSGTVLATFRAVYF